MHHAIRPPPPPPKDIFFQQKPKAPEMKAPVKAIQPEELTELLDDDLEQWAAGGTRILPKPQQDVSPASFAPTMQSFPPVAYASSPPPPVSPAKSHAAIWAAVIGMTSVFAIAAIVGAVFLVKSRASSEAITFTATTTTATATTTTVAAPPPIVTETVEAAPIATLAAPPVQPTRKTTAVAAAPPPPVAKADGMLQTFAAGNGKPVFVDGKQVGLGGTRIKTTCGKHAISVGSGRAKTVDVPCTGAAITVGSPDGS